MAHTRLDEELVSQGFFATQEQALRAILAGEVYGANKRFSSPGERVKQGLELHVKGHNPYVSRGGIKLERGLELFSVDVSGKHCLDVGCSTGGFTDCLLRHGAASVLAVDVGYAQFSWELRQDERVELLERTNIVDVPSQKRNSSIDVAVCDVSFTSVVHILSSVCELLKDDASFLTLVKPQFEVEREDVGEGGVVSDPEARIESLVRVAKAFEDVGLNILGACKSPIKGHKGNTEYLLYGGFSFPKAELDFYVLEAGSDFVLADESFSK